MKGDRLSDIVNETIEKLEQEVKESEENRETHYIAARLLKGFNEIFAPTWKDLNFAERMRKDREADKRNGHPWLGDE